MTITDQIRALRKAGHSDEDIAVYLSLDVEKVKLTR